MRQVSNEMLDNTPISIEYHFVTVENKFELTPDIYRNLLSIVKEAMANILKHSKATQVQIKSEYDKNIFTIYIIDNGIGIDKSIPNVAGRGRINMQQRVIKINGTIEFLSSDIGTTIKIQIPIVNN
jgi:signal transduction histidine kinase